MLYRLYYWLSGVFYRLQVRSLGKHTELRLQGRIIAGKYIVIGDKVKIDPHFLLAVFPTYAGRDNPVKSNEKGIVIGEGTTFNRYLTIYCADSVRIGKDVMFGGGILVTDNNHGMDAQSRPYSKQPLTTKEVVIEDGCWIAQNCCILAGSHIGKKSIIGANSVVNGDIPAYTIAAGSPAKVIRKWNFEKKCWVKIK